MKIRFFSKWIIKFCYIYVLLRLSNSIKRTTSNEDTSIKNQRVSEEILEKLEIKSMENTDLTETFLSGKKGDSVKTKAPRLSETETNNSPNLTKTSIENAKLGLLTVSKQIFATNDSGFKGDLTPSSSSSSFCETTCERNAKTYKQQISATSEESIPIIIDYNNNLNRENHNSDEFSSLHVKPRPRKIENETSTEGNTNSKDFNDKLEHLESPIKMSIDFDSKFKPSGAVFKSAFSKKDISPKATINRNEKVRSRSNSRSSSSNGIEYNDLGENLKKGDKNTKVDKVPISVSPVDYFSASSLSSICMSTNAENEAFSSSQSSSPKSIKNSSEFLASNNNKDLKSMENQKENSAILMILGRNKISIPLNSTASITPISANELLSLQNTCNGLQPNMVAALNNNVDQITNIDNGKLGM